MSIKDEKPVPPKNREGERSTADQLQSQIDALVRGEPPKGTRSLRDLTKKPIPASKNRKNGANKKPG